MNTNSSAQSDQTGNCWLFHRWSKWEQYIEQGTAMPRWGKMAGQEYSYSEERQRRHCTRCGLMEDVKV